MSDGRVALFVPSLRFGGAERTAVNLAHGLVQLGVPTDVVAVSAHGEYLRDLPASARIVDLGASRVLSGLWPLVRYLRQERPAALISFMHHAGIVAIWAGRLSGVSTRIVCTVHTTMSQATQRSVLRRNRALPLLVRAFYPWAHEVVAVSKGVAQDLSRMTGLAASRVRVVYNPVITPQLLLDARRPPEHEWLTAGGPPVVLGVGRLTPAKDFTTLIRAFGKVREHRDARLLIIGEGEERSRLEALVRELGLENQVALPGFVPGAAACMASAAVFVLSSAWEGLPTVLIEALAVGVPVVATDCPSGPREILRNGALGPLVPVGDADALASAILGALCRPAQVRQPPDLSEFTLEAAAAAYRDLALEG